MISQFSYANHYLIFINSDDPYQQEQVDQLNSLVFEQKSIPAEHIYLIDSASQEKPFRGEIQYLHDGEGRYVAKYLPRQLPEVIMVRSGRITQHYPLSDFLAEYLPPPVKEFP